MGILDFINIILSIVIGQKPITFRWWEEPF